MAWFENEEFWRDLYPYMFPVERLANAPDQVRQIVTLTGVQEGAVLDLCCGPGRHSVEFARQGFTVTGVDRSPYLLERARDHAAESEAGIDFVQEDMRAFRRPDSFELAVNIFTSFGYFENPGRGAAGSAQRARESPGGRRFRDGAVGQGIPGGTLGQCAVPGFRRRDTAGATRQSARGVDARVLRVDRHPGRPGAHSSLRSLHLFRTGVEGPAATQRLLRGPIVRRLAGRSLWGGGAATGGGGPSWCGARQGEGSRHRFSVGEFGGQRIDFFDDRRLGEKVGGFGNQRGGNAA